MSFIVKDDNFNNIVMSEDFAAVDKPLMVEIVRKRVYPGRMNDIRISKLLGEYRTKCQTGNKLCVIQHVFVKFRLILNRNNIGK